MVADGSIARWLIEPSTRVLPIEVVLTELVVRLGQSGLALTRLGVSLPALHPEIWMRRFAWTREAGAHQVVAEHDLPSLPTYLDSPVAAIHAGSGPIRCRLTGPDADLRYPICRDLAKEGRTDYFCMPIELGAGRRTYLSLATDDPAGFAESALAHVLGLSPYFSMWLELKASQQATQGLLEVYLGNLAAARVLAGEFRRGTGTAIQAAILTCDLRGFTAMSDAFPATGVVAALDQYFEAVAGPIGDHDGDVLKFIGDAMLAMFPVADGTQQDACARALAAAQLALGAMQRLNEVRETEGKPRLELGLALHIGEVMFGNVGARGRLDFTVIGAAVNEVCRMESLCKTLGTPLIVSARFSAALGDAGLVSLGEQHLRGVADPQQLFTLPAYAPR